MPWFTFAFGILVLSIGAAANLGFGRPLFDAVGVVPGGDKTCHFVLIGGLCGLVCRTLASWQTERGVQVIWYTIAAFLVLSTVEELSQRWLVERTFSLADLACNYAGIVTFGFLAIWWRRKSMPA